LDNELKGKLEMKIVLKKKQLKSLNNKTISSAATPAIVGANGGNGACGTTEYCHFDKQLVPGDTNVKTVPITF
jgi:hypothetical protein|tara:strand:+ start:381 stop:599 length:219 start_codon:yes stop_codon:yes gene_type:complete